VGTINDGLSRPRQMTYTITDNNGEACAECGGDGMIRWLGMNNDEEVAKCATCEIKKLRAILQDVVDDMLFCVGPSKGTMAKIHQALREALL
jgi:hypothetical protein